MQITPLFIYLVAKLETIQAIAFFASLLCGFGWFFGKLLRFINKSTFDDVSTVINFRWLGIISFISTIYLVFVPTKNDVIIMYAVPKIVNSDVAQKDIPELIDLTIKDLKKRLENKK